MFSGARMGETPSIARPRIVELDGLRGIAALWVVFYHLWGAIQRRDVAWVPDAVGDFFHAGFLGVDIFFVLSGFVITYSVAGLPITKTFVPRFILRRSVRIDPPYWAAIVLAISFMILKNMLFPSESVELPSLTEVVVHIFYLQDLLGYGNISSVFWTLCLEFQFYLIFAVFYHVTSQCTVRMKTVLMPLFVGLALILCGLTPVLRFSTPEWLIPGTLLPYAYEFIIGVLAYHCVTGRVRYRSLLVATLLMVAVTTVFKPVYYGLAPALTVLVIVLAREWRGVSLLKRGWVQLLGRVSYSLYLTHAVVGWVTISLFSYLLRGFDSGWVTAGIFASGLVTSLIFAYVFYRLVEEPSLKLSRRLKKRRSSGGDPLPVSNVQKGS